MSEPWNAERGDVPRAVPQPTPTVPPPGPDDDLAGRRRALQAVPDPLPAPEPGEPVAPRTASRPVRQLAWNEISYFVAMDPDKFSEEDFYRDPEFDRGDRPRTGARVVSERTRTPVEATGSGPQPGPGPAPAQQPRRPGPAGRTP
jgi:hypothetical protein